MSKLLVALAALTTVLVGGLGAWGWTARDDARAAHLAAISAENQEQFCEVLGSVVGPLTGRILDSDAPAAIPFEPEGWTLISAGSNLAYFAEQLEEDAPPAVREDLRVLEQAGNEAMATQTPEPLLQGPARQAIGNLEQYWDDNCR